MTGASVCTGIAAAEQAAPWIEWKFCAEIEQFPSEVIAARFGHPNLGDITAEDFLDRAAQFGRIDVLAAGTPCQAFSVAGQGGSLSDDRGNLTLRFTEIADAIDPRVIWWENVPGVLSQPDNAFGCFLGALVGHGAPIVPPAGHRRWRTGKRGRYFAWPNCGYVSGPRRSTCWRVQDAQYHGVPQRRERVWLIASPRAGGIDPRRVLLEPARMQGHIAPRREAREDIAGTVAARTRGGGGLGTDFDLAGGLQPVANSLKTYSGRNQIESNYLCFNLHDREHGAQVAPPVTMTLNAKAGRRYDAESETFVAEQWRVRRLMPVECERLQGMREYFTAILRGKKQKPAADAPRYKAIGNSWAVPNAKWVADRIRKEWEGTNEAGN